MIKQECRDPAQYNSIIRAIATGASRMSEICSKTDIDTSLATSYLNKLISLGIIKKITPFGTSNSRKSIYSLEDSMFRFWYRFIPDNIASINHGLSELAYQKITPQISTFMGGVFEEICKQYLWELNRQGKAAVTFNDLGRFWGNDSKNKREAEIDIMCSVDNDSAIYCECKWTNEKVDVSVLESHHVFKTHKFYISKFGSFIHTSTSVAFLSKEIEKDIGLMEYLTLTYRASFVIFSGTEIISSVSKCDGENSRNV